MPWLQFSHSRKYRYEYSTYDTVILIRQLCPRSQSADGIPVIQHTNYQQAVPPPSPEFISKKKGGNVAVQTIVESTFPRIDSYYVTLTRLFCGIEQVPITLVPILSWTLTYTP